MSRELQRDHRANSFPEDELCRIRWFLLRIYAIALILSILAGMIITILMKNPLPGLIPAPLLLSMRPMIQWAFPRSPDIEKGKI